jgi:hypothetical protein
MHDSNQIYAISKPFIQQLFHGIKAFGLNLFLDFMVSATGLNDVLQPENGV